MLGRRQTVLRNTLVSKTIWFYGPKPLHKNMDQISSILFKSSAPTDKLYPMRQLIPAGLPCILLIGAGIEPNPGPRSESIIVQSAQMSLRANTTSVRCTSCNAWCHLRSCSDWTSHQSDQPSTSNQTAPTITQAPRINFI